MIGVRNGEAVARADVPMVDLREAIEERVSAGARVSALFPVGAELWCALTDPVAGLVRLGRGPLESVPPLRAYEHRFHRIDGTHEVAVGPVHAGVIEPGHFRFQCHGERVLRLEIALGYQHRGVQRALVGGPDKRSLHYAETVAGDTTVGHATAYCRVVEGLAGCAVPEKARTLRAIALELERLANHTGDLGALSGDVGYLPVAAFCGRLRGDWLNLTAELCGSRFGRGLVVPGGVRFAVDAPRASAAIERLDRAMRDLVPSIRLLWDTPLVAARFEDTGRVTQEVAAELGLLGVAARASGLLRDVRIDLDAGPIPIAAWTTGDVMGRARVRALEIERSAAFVRSALAGLGDGLTRTPVAPTRPDAVSVALVEGWRGEICHVALTGPDGRFEAYEIADPSSRNWAGLEAAMRDQAISDFPLCNKSFNLSYCGVDR